jgi:hypothetical protein
VTMPLQQAAPALTQASHLPRGVIPGPVTLPARRPHPAVVPRPAAQPATRRPRDIIADLAAQLRVLGVAARMYATAGPDRAVLSLPQLTIWATGRSLYWTHHGLPVTWPAGDTAAAARHIAQLTRPSQAPAPPPAP